MQLREEIQVKRNCEALQVPSGQKVQLKKGSVVTLTQALGGSFTVITDSGNMARVDGTDADALGKEAMETPTTVDTANLSCDTVQERVWEQLKTCYDPEIPVNIVDLGLVYCVDVSQSQRDENDFSVYIQMTLTAPGCGMGEVLAADAWRKSMQVAGVKEVDIEYVFDPPWDREMISEAGKLQLGLI